MSDGTGRLAELEARLQKLAEATRAELPERAKALRMVLARLPSDEAPARAELRRLAHMVRGSAGSHGMHELTEPAAGVEVAANTLPVTELMALANALADRLETTSRARPTASAPTTAPPASAPTTPGPGLIKPLAGRRVLAIDDDQATRRLLAMTLVNLGGANATIVGDARAFFEALEADAYEAIIVDAMMPEMNGLQCLERIAGTPQARPNAHYFVLSAATPDELRWILPTSLEIAWLRKPFRPRELIDAIVHAL